MILCEFLRSFSPLNLGHFRQGFPVVLIPPSFLLMENRLVCWLAFWLLRIALELFYLEPLLFKSFELPLLSLALLYLFLILSIDHLLFKLP